MPAQRPRWFVNTKILRHYVAFKSTYGALGLDSSVFRVSEFWILTAFSQRDVLVNEQQQQHQPKLWNLKPIQILTKVFSIVQTYNGTNHTTFHAGCP